MDAILGLHQVVVLVLARDQLVAKGDRGPLTLVQELECWRNSG